jgi:hypothetical protein
VSFPASRRSAADIRCPLHQLIDDETLCASVPFDLDISLALVGDDGGVESKLLLVQLQESEHSGYELQPIFVDIKWHGRDGP